MVGAVALAWHYSETAEGVQASQATCRDACSADSACNFYLWRHDAAIRAMILQGMGYRGIADRLQAEHGLKVTVRAVQLYGRKLCHGDLFDGLKQERAAFGSVVG